MAGRAAAVKFGMGGGPGPGIGGGEIPAEDDGKGLRRYLLDKFKRGEMTAKAVCDVAWFSHGAGASGVADLAYKPSGSHQAEHLMSILRDASGGSVLHRASPDVEPDRGDAGDARFPNEVAPRVFRRCLPSKGVGFQGCGVPSRRPSPDLRKAPCDCGLWR